MSTPGSDGAPGMYNGAYGSDSMQMANMGSEGMKRVESMEALNVTIHQCARDGNVDVMRRLLDQLGNVRKKINQHDEDKLSPLHYAARYNHFEMVRLLVERGADINNKGDDNLTPLHYAARYKRIKKSKSADNLVDEAKVETDDEVDNKTETTELSGGEEEKEEEDADPSQQNVTIVRVGFDEPKPKEKPKPEEKPAKVKKPAPVAVQDEAEPGGSVILLLVERGADINAKDFYGLTPLHFAAMRGNEIACRDLLSHPGIRLETVDKQQMTALHLACTHNNAAIVKILIQAGANLRCCDDEMSTPLHMAASEGSVEIVKMMFQAGELKDGWVTVSQMVTDQDIERSTALHLAVDNSHFEVAKLCLEKGSNVNAARDGYATPLHLAAVSGDLRIVKLLVEHGARIDALNSQQATPLHRAAAYNHADVVQFLLNKGAQIERRDKDNFTPLLLAACYGHSNTIKMLLKSGADLSATDKHGKTAIFWSSEENKQDALKVLLEHPKSEGLVNEGDRFDNEPLHIAAQEGYVACVKILLDHGADINGKNEEEQTPLHLAAKNGRTNVVRELINFSKSVVNDEDEESNTALHLAALTGHTKVVRALIEAGDDVEARNSYGWTPLDCAAARGFTKTARSLLEADSPVDPTDKNKTTPLHLACKFGHVPMVELLLQWNANVGQRDADGNNCLDLAIDHNQEDVAMVLIKSDKWDEALRNQGIHLKWKTRDTPMRKLIRKMPDVAEQVFHKCTTANMSNPDHPDYAITFSYEFLDDMYSDWREKGSSDAMSTTSSIYDEDGHVQDEARPYTSDSGMLKKNHPLMIMVNSRREDLLAHPLVTSLLRHKWNHFGRYIYYLNLFLYSIFLIFLTGYILTTEAPYELINRTLFNGSDISEIASYTCDQIASIDKDQLTVNNLSQSVFAVIGKYAIMGLAVWNLIWELFQFYHAKLNYFGIENLIEWIVYICALLLVIDFNVCLQENPGIREPWQWMLGAIAIFLAWMALVLFIRKLPRLGIYVVMFTDILKTFCQFFIVFFLFIVAFGLSFHVLFKNREPFLTPARSLLKTSVMMIGEFEYDTIFTAEFDKLAYREHVFYEWTSYVLFVVFLILMPIIIMNLLVGLAVDDIKAVQEQAVLTRLAMQVDLALDVEGVLPQYFRRKFVLRSKTIKPNEVGCFSRMIGKEGKLSSGLIQQALNPELDRLDYLEEQQDKMIDQMTNLKMRMKNMKETNDQIVGMLQGILNHYNISYQEQDEHEEEDVGLSAMGM